MAFFSIIESLKKKSILLKKNSKYYWQGGINDSNLREKKLLCSLLISLYYNNYLKLHEPQMVVNAINNFFENVSISLTIYLRYLNKFSDKETRSKSPYFSYFHFIK